MTVSLLLVIIAPQDLLAVYTVDQVFAVLLDHPPLGNMGQILFSHMTLFGLLDSPVDRGIVHPEMGGDLDQAIPMAACRREEMSSRSVPFQKYVGERGRLVWGCRQGISAINRSGWWRATKASDPKLIFPCTCSQGVAPPCPSATMTCRAFPRLVT